MIDINLHQAVEKDLKISRRKNIFKSGSFISFSLLALVVVLFGAIKLYQKTLETKEVMLTQMKSKELASFDAGTVNDLTDFQKRLDSISFNLENKDNPDEITKIVESLMVEGASLNSLSYDDMDKKIELEVVADSFRLAANQMLSLKKSGLFSNVLINDSSRNEVGQAIFKLEALLNSENNTKNK